MGITKAEALKAVDRERGPVCEASDRIWDQPETAFQEFHSTDVLCELLEKEGFRVERNLAGIATAFSGTYGSGKPVVGILGEFDALSGLSQESESLEKTALVDGAPGHGLRPQSSRNRLCSGCNRGKRVSGEERERGNRDLLWLSGRGRRIRKELYGERRRV